MEQTIHPEALKTFRKNRKLTQAALAKKCGCNSAQVSRWERGQSLRLRSILRERLPKALGVSWDELTSPPKGSDDPEEGLGIVQLNVRVEPKIRTAFQLVCLRYKLQLADVIRLAPLLFLIIAEKSLAHRQANNDAILEGLDRTENEYNAAAPHLMLGLIVRHSHLTDALESEQDSISQRDVFGRYVDLQNDYEDDDEDYNPFMNYLKILIEDIPSKLVTNLWPWEDRIYYTIAEETLREVTGITGETEAEEKMINEIKTGSIDLKEIISSRKNLSREEYLTWLQEKIETARQRGLDEL